MAAMAPLAAQTSGMSDRRPAALAGVEIPSTALSTVSRASSSTGRRSSSQSTTLSLVASSFSASPRMATRKMSSGKSESSTW